MTTASEHSNTTTAGAGAGPSLRQRQVSSQANRSRLLSTFGPLGALVVVSVVFSIINPTYATWSNVTTMLNQAAVPLVLAMGATLVILAGSIDLSIEGVMAVSGLTFVLLARNTVNGNDFGLLAILAALAVGLAVGLVSGLAHAVLKIPSFMVTLGTWYIGLGIATVLFGTTVAQLQDDAFTAWPSGSFLGLPHGIYIAAVVVAVTFLFVKHVRAGRQVLAVGQDESLSHLNGLNVRRTKILVFAIAGLLSGLAGVLATMQLGNGIVEVGSGQLFFTTAAVVVGGTVLAGGRGGPLRSVVGVFLLTAIANGLVLAGVSPEVQQGVSGVVIICAVVLAGYRLRQRTRVVK